MLDLKDYVWRRFRHVLVGKARREIRDLGQLAADARLEAAHTRQEKDKKKGRRRG